MRKQLTSDQRSLAEDVLELALTRQAIAAQLGEIDQLYRQAIALAAQYGVKQTLIADLAGISAPRVSQIADATLIPEISIDDFNDLVSNQTENPHENLDRIADTLARAQHADTTRQFALIDGAATLGH
ncbi:MAG: hypothetical protein ABI130_16310 [Leifsonia sp.]